MLLWYHRTPRENDKVWNEPYNKKDIGNGVLFVCKKEESSMKRYFLKHILCGADEAHHFFHEKKNFVGTSFRL